MNGNISGGMSTYATMPMGGPEINIGMTVGSQCSESNRRPNVPSACANPKKKRRISAKVAKSKILQSSNNLGPPLLTGYGDTIIVSNPFDDAPYRAPPLSSSNLPRMRKHRTAVPPINGMNPMRAQNPGTIQPTIVNSTRAVRPINNMTQNYFNGPTMNDLTRMGLMGNHEMRQSSMNSCMHNVSVKTGIPSNGFNCVNNPNLKYEKTLYHNETSPFHLNQMGPTIRENSTIGASGPNATSSGDSLNDSLTISSSDWQETLDMFIQQFGEKVYPVDQSVVFDPQNPLAPPIYPCGICHKKVNSSDQGIICQSGCSFWFHRACLGLSEAAFQLLTKEIYAEWACDNCLRSKNIPVVKFIT